MKNKKLSKIFFILLVSFLLLQAPLAALAGENVNTDTDVSTEVTAADLGASESAIDNANKEETEAVTESGTLIEIGNTTADETTVIIRTTDEEGNTEDQTVEIDSNTQITDDAQKTANLSDWIAGDPITFTAIKYKNSGQILARKLRNRAFKRFHRGKNGWITAIRPDKNEMDVTWRNQIFTLNTENARMVAGLKNPATFEDFKVGDRVRARVVDDGDSNPATWDAKIIVVLRRGKNLFMRVTRWVVPAEITMIPEDLTLPTTIDVKILPSKFYEKGDVNNLIGAPGDALKVDIDENTKLRRRFFGKALLKEFSEGDKIRIIGRLNEETGHLTAKFIKNNSIQKLGVAHRLGKVVSIDASSRTINVKLIRTRRANKNWTVNVLENAKILKGGEEISLDEIKTNDIIRVRGVANRLQKSVDASLVVVIGSLY